MSMRRFQTKPPSPLLPATLPITANSTQYSTGPGRTYSLAQSISRAITASRLTRLKRYLIYILHNSTALGAGFKTFLALKVPIEWIVVAINNRALDNPMIKLPIYAVCVIGSVPNIFFYKTTGDGVIETLRYKPFLPKQLFEINKWCVVYKAISYAFIQAGTIMLLRTERLNDCILTLAMLSLAVQAGFITLSTNLIPNRLNAEECDSIRRIENDLAMNAHGPGNTTVRLSEHGTNPGVVMAQGLNSNTITRGEGGPESFNIILGIQTLIAKLGRGDGDVLELFASITYLELLLSAQNPNSSSQPNNLSDHTLRFFIGEGEKTNNPKGSFFSSSSARTLISILIACLSIIPFVSSGALFLYWCWVEILPGRQSPLVKNETASLKQQFDADPYGLICIAIAFVFSSSIFELSWGPATKIAHKCCPPRTSKKPISLIIGSGEKRATMTYRTRFCCFLLKVFLGVSAGTGVLFGIAFIVNATAMRFGVKFGPEDSPLELFKSDPSKGDVKWPWYCYAIFGINVIISLIAGSILNLLLKGKAIEELVKQCDQYICDKLGGSQNGLVSPQRELAKKRFVLLIRFLNKIFEEQDMLANWVGPNDGALPVTSIPFRIEGASLSTIETETLTAIMTSLFAAPSDQEILEHINLSSGQALSNPYKDLVHQLLVIIRAWELYKQRQQQQQQVCLQEPIVLNIAPLLAPIPTTPAQMHNNQVTQEVMIKENCGITASEGNGTAALPGSSSEDPYANPDDIDDNPELRDIFYNNNQIISRPPLGQSRPPLGQTRPPLGQIGGNTQNKPTHRTSPFCDLHDGSDLICIESAADCSEVPTRRASPVSSGDSEAYCPPCPTMDENSPGPSCSNP